MNKAFFLDRDGTLNVDYNYVHTPQEWTWCYGAVPALRWIRNHDFKIVVVTNQSGITRGYYTENHVQQLHRWVDKRLAEEDIAIDRWLYAPHHPEHDPEENFAPADRKPGTGMFEKAASELNIDFSRSYMAGDKITDLKPAAYLGINPIFIRSRHAPDQDQQWLQENALGQYDSLWQGIQDLFVTE